MNQKRIIMATLFLAIGLGIGFVASSLRYPDPREVAARHKDEHDVHDHGADPHDPHDDEAGVIHLNEAQMTGLNLETAPVTEGSLAGTIELPGEVQWNTDNLVHVAPRVSGIVVDVEKTLGDRVEAGDVLCILDSREMGNAKMEYLADLARFKVAQADFDRARAVHENTAKLMTILDAEPTSEQALEKAKDLPIGENKNKLLTAYTKMNVNRGKFRRIDELLKSKIASEADFLEAKGDYEISRADYLSTREEIKFNLKLNFLRAEKDFDVSETEMRNSQRALLILGLTEEDTAQLAEQGNRAGRTISRNRLHSPISGIVVDRHLTHGELVDPKTALYTIADLSSVWVMGRVYERDLRFLAKRQKARIRLDAFPDEHFEGVVDYLDSQLDPATRTIQARVVLPNPQARFRPGMFGNVTVFAGTKAEQTPNDKALIVPDQALQRVQGGFVVYKRIEPDEFQQVAVRVLNRTRESAQVIGELKPGDPVVIGDTFVLKSQAGKEEMGGGHSH